MKASTAPQIIGAPLLFFYRPEAFEAPYALKQLVVAGARVVCYPQDREITFKSDPNPGPEPAQRAQELTEHSSARLPPRAPW